MKTELLKKLVLAVSLMVVGNMAFSQTHYSSNVCIGAHAGIDLPRVFFSPAVKQSWYVEPMMGVGIRYIEENHFGLIAEVNWVRRGWKENFEGLNFKYIRNIDYIEIPVFAHIYFGKKARFYLNAGPQIAFKISDSVDANFDVDHLFSVPDFPHLNRRNEQLTEKISQKVDYGISAVLGCEYNINPKNSVTLEARYYFGLGNIMPSKRQDTFKASNTMYLAFNVGYWFRIK